MKFYRRRLSAFGDPLLEKGAIPVGAVVPSPPAIFPPYQIHPEVIGAYPQKGFIPAMFATTQARSSFVKGQSVIPVDSNVARAATKAAQSDARAASAKVKAIETQRVADAVEHDAIKTEQKAVFDPLAQAEAYAKAMAARKATLQAQRDAEAAALHEEQADRDAAKVHEMLDQTGFTEPYPDQYGPPGVYVDPSIAVPAPGSSIANVALIAGGAAAGFFTLGPLGALAGALGVYFIRR